MSQLQAYVLIDYNGPYCQPLIEAAARDILPVACVELISDASQYVKTSRPLLQFLPYESIDFQLGLANPRSSFNAYVIRKALIRKHYLSNTVAAWTTKHKTSSLKLHFRPTVDLELDYAEFLEDALLEAFELRESFERNSGSAPHEREWWILKPGMSDRGQGIRLFSTEDELRSIFEGWEAEYPETDEESSPQSGDHQVADEAEGIMISQLRYFVAQPYVHPPFLFAGAPYNNRKFHIRTYVVAAGALRVYVYQRMLALFATTPYEPPSTTHTLSENEDDFKDVSGSGKSFLQRFKNIHLTNTCVQSSRPDDTDRNHMAYLLSALPFSDQQSRAIKKQISNVTAEVFRAALSQPTNFQPLPQSFEIFGFDFLVSGSSAHREEPCVWLLEVNAFPDFAQTGEGLRDAVVKPLFEDVMRVVVGPQLGTLDRDNTHGTERLVKVLDNDLGRG
ncbi:MAG: hypothetical protein M1828_004313 [Chrysothrix sp. TS-e1954]|nr:MAG: hypothetical protein M1828_004313 [Chrysothrix sp. TS-e1954]